MKLTRATTFVTDGGLPIDRTRAETFTGATAVLARRFRINHPPTLMARRHPQAQMVVFSIKVILLASSPKVRIAARGAGAVSTAVR
jgi:hypothetical protein